MAVKASGNPLAFSEIETEFGQNTDRDLGEYRVSQTVGALSNQPLDTGIPQGSNPISFSDFYSKRLNVVIDYHSGSAENRPDDARTKYQAASTSGNRTVIGFPATKDRISGNSSGSKVRIHVNKTIGSAVGNINNCAVRTGSFETGTVVTVEVGSSGAIYGAGGDGGEAGDGEGANGSNGGSGSSGLGVQFTGTTVINNGVISAGYGGGGGGGYRKVEREEMFSGPVYAANGGGGGGGQGLPSGEGIDGGADGTTTAGGNGGNGGESSQAHGGGGGGGGSNGEGGRGGAGTDGEGNPTDNGNNGGDGTSSSGGNGAAGTHTGSIEGENNVTSTGGTGGGNGAAIRRTSGITVNITNNATITGGTTDTGVA